MNIRQLPFVGAFGHLKASPSPMKRSTQIFERGSFGKASYISARQLLLILANVFRNNLKESAVWAKGRETAPILFEDSNLHGHQFADPSFRTHHKCTRAKTPCEQKTSRSQMQSDKK